MELVYVISMLSLFICSIARTQAEECGTRSGNIVFPLMIGGYEAYRGEFPWHVALYRRLETGEWQQHCGGTLISRDLILTATHCVVLASRIDINDVRVGLGKIHREMTHAEESSVIARVKEMVFPLFMGSAWNYAQDIALLQLSDEVRFSDVIRPACVDWNQTVHLVSGETVYVAGWGATENNTPSELLLTAQLKYLDLGTCVNKMLDRNLPLSGISHDKICAQMLDGSQVKRGDSGSGMTVVRNNQYFIIGIVSAGFDTIKKSEFSLFTRMSDKNHLSWLATERARLLNESLSKCDSDDKCPDNKQCFSNTCRNPCLHNMSCGKNTTCQTRKHQVFCDCLPGLVKVDPNDVTSACRECYIDDECPGENMCMSNKCENACRYNVCGKNSLCQVRNHRTFCECPPGYVTVNPGDMRSACEECISDKNCTEGKMCVLNKCIDPCLNNMICGKNTTCRVRTHEMFCDCLPGYVRTNPAAVTSACGVPECQEDSDCKDEVCRQGRCQVSACVGKCGPNTNCEASAENIAVCTCKPGHSGYPDDKTMGCKPECRTHSDCADREMCVTRQCADPCEHTACGAKSKCVTVNHVNTKCQCLPDFYRFDPRNDTSACGTRVKSAELSVAIHNSVDTWWTSVMVDKASFTLQTRDVFVELTRLVCYFGGVEQDFKMHITIESHSENTTLTHSARTTLYTLMNIPVSTNDKPVLLSPFTLYTVIFSCDKDFKILAVLSPRQPGSFFDLQFPSRDGDGYYRSFLSHIHYKVLTVT